jgi:hypothetical protein
MLTAACLLSQLNHLHRVLGTENALVSAVARSAIRPGRCANANKQTTGMQDQVPARCPDFSVLEFPIQRLHLWYTYSSGPLFKEKQYREATQRVILLTMV